MFSFVRAFFRVLGRLPFLIAVIMVCLLLGSVLVSLNAWYRQDYGTLAGWIQIIILVPTIPIILNQLREVQESLSLAQNRPDIEIGLAERGVTSDKINAGLELKSQLASSSLESTNRPINAYFVIRNSGNGSLQNAKLHVVALNATDYQIVGKAAFKFDDQVNDLFKVHEITNEKILYSRMPTSVFAKDSVLIPFRLEITDRGNFGEKIPRSYRVLLQLYGDGLKAPIQRELHLIIGDD